MGFKKLMPATVNVRVQKFRGLFYVLARNGKRWKVIDKAEIRDEALKVIEQYHTDKDIRYRMDVLMRDFFACVGCGERDRGLLEVHHIKPRAQFPDLAYELNNGETDCLWRHILMSKHDLVAQNLILLRLVKILTKRLFGGRLSKCQKALLESS